MRGLGNAYYHSRLQSSPFQDHMLGATPGLRFPRFRKGRYADLVHTVEAVLK
jgi:hypothetical protein